MSIVWQHGKVTMQINVIVMPSFVCVNADELKTKQTGV